jgi:hypothetical protein
MKAAEKDRDQIRYLERQQKELEIQLAREEAAHKREMGKAARRPRIRDGPLWGHGRHGHRTADAISGGSQAGILGDLARVRT